MIPNIWENKKCSKPPSRQDPVYNQVTERPRFEASVDELHMGVFIPNPSCSVLKIRILERAACQGRRALEAEVARVPSPKQLVRVAVEGPVAPQLRHCEAFGLVGADRD